MARAGLNLTRAILYRPSSILVFAFSPSVSLSLCPLWLML